MPSGSLVQIVAQGSQDIFLTSIPEMTFFKTVYYKHTNFAVDPIEIQLDGEANFDRQVITTLPKTGDLLYKLLLKVTIPRVDLVNEDVFVNEAEVADLNANIIRTKELLKNYKEFFRLNYIILNCLSLEIKSVGSNWTTINAVIADKKTRYSTSIAEIDVALDDVISRFNGQFPASAKDNYTGSAEKESLLLSDVANFISEMKDYYKDEERIQIDKLNDQEVGLERITTNKEYFAWVKKIGFYMIKRLSILVGGTEITRYTGEYLDMYHSLNSKYFHEANLDSMIGNVSALTDYSNETKDSYTLYIPIPLWTGLHSGNALPLISMVYHDIEVDIEFEALDKCCYFTGVTNITNYLHLGTVEILADYVYLDKDEREKFAQFSHEYLVENTKEVFASSLNISSFTMDIDIYHSTKELYWVLTENDRVEEYKLYSLFYPVNIITIGRIIDNGNGTITLRSDQSVPLNSNIFAVGKYISIKYSKYYDNKYKIVEYSPTSLVVKAKYAEYVNYNDRQYGIMYNEPTFEHFNPIKLQNITFRGENRTPFTDPTYYNYIVPYQYYEKTPMDGLNTYSFSLHPRKFQPSGSCNMNLIKSKVLNIELNDDYYNYILENGLNYSIRLYAGVTNILRITNGITALVFTA